VTRGAEALELGHLAVSAAVGGLFDAKAANGLGDFASRLRDSVRSVTAVPIENGGPTLFDALRSLGAKVVKL
jgi:hypothetical protein